MQLWVCILAVQIAWQSVGYQLLLHSCVAVAVVAEWQAAANALLQPQQRRQLEAGVK